MNIALPSVPLKVLRYELSDVIRSKWVVAYALFFLGLTEALFRLAASGAQVLLSLLNVVLVLLPLVALVFGAMYLYHARPFIELMLAQPVRRSHLFSGLYAGLVLPLAGGFVGGVAIPFVLHGLDPSVPLRALLLLLTVGTVLTAVFVALAFLIATRFEDRVKGLGVALLVWLVATVGYDGLVLIVANAFSAYPLERPLLALTLLNPVDLGRVLLLLHFDVAALMGYTGAVFEQFFGSLQGTLMSAGALLVWGTAPLLLALRRFRRHDF